MLIGNAGFVPAIVGAARPQVRHFASRPVDVDLVDLLATTGGGCAGEQDGLAAFRVAGVDRLRDAGGHVQDHALDGGRLHRDVDFSVSLCGTPNRLSRLDLPSVTDTVNESVCTPS